MVQVIEILVASGQNFLHSLYHGCWCSGNTIYQGISNHDIDLILMGCSKFSTKQVKRWYFLPK